MVRFEMLGVEGFFVINESDENWNPMIDRRVVLSKSCLFWCLRVVQDYGEQGDRAVVLDKKRISLLEQQHRRRVSQLRGCFADPQASIEHCCQRAEKGLLPVFIFRRASSTSASRNSMQSSIAALLQESDANSAASWMYFTKSVYAFGESGLIIDVFCPSGSAAPFWLTMSMTG
ncbi:hypothetical protein QR680_012120 [Steinernema hermaphroditum]|uniref:Uncharacterized protein n=1 Tax=Steinernema hermaphroditum TaxID=289476 RepID=A0AA39I0Y6_9BILA|nr:hypothetical protein QR680_012120 [Steinernema hermaphroditum]